MANIVVMMLSQVESDKIAQYITVLEEILDNTRVHFNVKIGECKTCKTPDSFLKRSGNCYGCAEGFRRAGWARQNAKTKLKRLTPEYGQYRKKRNIQVRKKHENNPQLVLVKRIRSRVTDFLRLKGMVKLKSTKEMLGCEYDFLKTHIESQFSDGMGWHNMGQWHIDHRIPLATAKSEEDVIRLNHHTNLRPMWALDNLRKGTRITDGNIN